MDFNLFHLNELKAGNVIKGPAIIFDDISTLVVGEGDSVNLDGYRVIHYTSGI